MAEIGFIGLGNMGRPMAANLVKAGHRLRGFDLVPEACAAAAKDGVAIAASGVAAAEGAEIIVTMLPAGRHLLECYGGSAGVLAAAKPGTLFIDCSTVDVESAKRAHGLVRDAGMMALDAPVSGGVGGAVAASLTFMVGGSAEAFHRAEPILAAMGRKIIHCGEAGAGQAAKICNNMILGVSMIAVAEAFVLAEQLGLSDQALFDVASTSSGQCWSLTSYCPVPGPVPTSPANNGYRPGFAAELMLKDLELARAAAEATGAETALGRHAAELYKAFVAGSGGKDFSAIIEDVRARSGTGGAG